MVYADTNFFIGLLNQSDAHHEKAKSLHKEYKGNIQTSMITLAEILVGCENHESDPEIIASAVFDVAEVFGITREQAMTAAHLMQEDKLKPMDALHCAIAGKEIISADKDMDRTGIKRIW
jgi:predicted nucleic acid-binding protein